MNFQMNLNRFLSLLALCTIVCFSSCKKDDDPENENFIAAYNTVEDCNGYADIYVIIITAGANDNELLLSNIFDAGVSGTKATVNGDNFTIAAQTLANSAGYMSTIEGSGSISDDVLTFDFILKEDNYDDTSCTAVCTKQ